MDIKYLKVIACKRFSGVPMVLRAVCEGVAYSRIAVDRGETSLSHPREYQRGFEWWGLVCSAKELMIFSWTLENKAR